MDDAVCVKEQEENRGRVCRPYCLKAVNKQEKNEQYQDEHQVHCQHPCQARQPDQFGILGVIINRRIDSQHQGHAERGQYLAYVNSPVSFWYTHIHTILVNLLLGATGYTCFDFHKFLAVHSE